MISSSTRRGHYAKMFNVDTGNNEIITNSKTQGDSSLNAPSPSTIRKQNLEEKKISNYEEAWDLKLARLGIKSIDSMWTIKKVPEDSTLKHVKDDQDPDSGHQKSSSNNDSSGKSNMGNSSSDSLSSHSLTDEWEDKRSLSSTQISPAIPPRLRRMSNSATQTDLPNSSTNHTSREIDLLSPTTNVSEAAFSFSRINSEPLHAQMVESIPRSRRHTTSENSSQISSVSIGGSSRPTRKHSRCNPLFQGLLLERSIHGSQFIMPNNMSQSVIVNANPNQSNLKLRPYHEEEEDDEAHLTEDRFMHFTHRTDTFLDNINNNRYRNETIKRPSLRRAISYGPSQNSRMMMQHSWMSNFDDFNSFEDDGSYFGTCDQIDVSSIIHSQSNMSESLMGKRLDGKRYNRRSESVASKSNSRSIKEGILNSSSFMNLKNHLFGSREDEILSKKGWYHPTMTRQESEDVLKNSPPGSYLVRKSETNKSGYSLSVKCSREYLHMKIILDKTTGKYILGEFSKPYRSITEMISHYTINLLPIRGSSPILLKYPCCSLNVS